MMDDVQVLSLRCLVLRPWNLLLWGHPRSPSWSRTWRGGQTSERKGGTKFQISKTVIVIFSMMFCWKKSNNGADSKCPPGIRWNWQRKTYWRLPKVWNPQIQTRNLIRCLPKISSSRSMLEKLKNLGVWYLSKGAEALHQRRSWMNQSQLSCGLYLANLPNTDLFLRDSHLP